MNNKIIVPKQVANAIAHYVALADTKTEALQDILRLGYEAERSEIILRYFEHDYDELMEALICGYEVEKSPEEKVREFYEHVKSEREALSYYAPEYYRNYEKFWTMERTIKMTLNRLGIYIDGVNSDGGDA
jgi:DNA integrity scanning protein DisA with diadenylate cyclase activity